MTQPGDAHPEAGSSRAAGHVRQRALGATLLAGRGEPVTLVLVRHGQTEMTAARVYAGGDGPGASLSGRGRTEAARAADLVRRIGREAWPDLPAATVVLSSSMLRTQETAAAIGRRIGARVGIDDSFAECRFGAWEGLSAEEIGQRWPGEPWRWHRDATVRAVGGESQEDVAQRFRDAVRRLLAEHAGQTVAIATHTVTIRAGVGSLAGLEPAAWSMVRVPPASVTIVRVWPDSHELTVLACPSDL